MTEDEQTDCTVQSDKRLVLIGHPQASILKCVFWPRVRSKWEKMHETRANTHHLASVGYKGPRPAARNYEHVKKTHCIEAEYKLSCVKSFLNE